MTAQIGAALLAAASFAWIIWLGSHPLPDEDEPPLSDGHWS